VFDVQVDSLKGRFFDRPRVLRAVGRGERRALSRFGAFVRRRDQTSQRRRRAVSRPGEPPSAHVGLVREQTYFAYDPAARSVVIGPALLRRADGRTLRLLEHGGETTIIYRGRRVRAVYRPRPHTGPAFATELSRAAPCFRDTVKG